MGGFEAIQYMSVGDSTLKSLNAFEERMKRLTSFGDTIKSITERSEQLINLSNRFDTQALLRNAMPDYASGISESALGFGKNAISNAFPATKDIFGREYGAFKAVDKLSFTGVDTALDPIQRYLSQVEEHKKDFLENWAKRLSVVEESVEDLHSANNKELSFWNEWTSWGPLTKIGFIITILGFMGFDLKDIVALVDSVRVQHTVERVIVARPHTGPMCIDTTLD